MIRSTIKTGLNNLKKRRLARKAAAQIGNGVSASPTTAAAEAPTKSSDALTLQHVKAVAQTVKTIGGFDRLKELLEVIREVGGLKKFKDLLEAISIPSTDGTPS